MPPAGTTVTPAAARRPASRASSAAAAPAVAGHTDTPAPAPVADSGGAWRPTGNVSGKDMRPPKGEWAHPVPRGLPPPAIKKTLPSLHHYRQAAEDRRTVPGGYTRKRDTPLGSPGVCVFGWPAPLPPASAEVGAGRFRCRCQRCRDGPFPSGRTGRPRVHAVPLSPPSSAFRLGRAASRERRPLGVARTVSQSIAGSARRVSRVPRR